MQNGYEVFKNQLFQVLGIDLNSYKEQQMRRRINQWLTRHSMASYTDLIARIRTDLDHRAAFTKYLTINTSQFFRDQGVFESIARQVLPSITSGGNMPRIWSAGCSIGAEIYSIAMLLIKQGARARELLGTDIDEVILARAREGTYSDSEVGGVPPDLLKAHFVKSGNLYQISDTLRRMVKFARHDLLQDPYPKPFDLVLCRNVFIYFTADTQKRLIHSFVDSLKPGGFFVVGSAEHIMDPHAFGLERVSYCIYAKTV
ncbi:MAG TPA: protein-glutamate O-methyltransferase CheR [Firmicutes bacterium]|nr:protein-glutamate O-methyltransferase CheR [Bacillota bacterium]